MVDIYMLISSIIGTIILGIVIVSICVWAINFLYNWIWHCSRYCVVVFRAERKYHDAISAKWKERRCYKLQFILRAFFVEGAEIATMCPHTSWTNRRLYFSKKKMFVVHDTTP